MMATTHAAAGLSLAATLVAVAPELAPMAAIGALLGGVFPDVDLFVGTHRKSLHFPVYYSALGVLVGALAVTSPTPLLVAVAFFFLSAGLHSISDWFGAGDELRPWNRTSDRAVYVHPLRRWLRPKYLVRYDGAPEDLALTLLLFVPGVLAFDGAIRISVVVGIAVALFYTGFRKRMPEWFGI